MNYQESKDFFQLIQIIRDYFKDQKFLDIPSPPAVEHPGMEAHLHPFQLHSIKNNKNIPVFLHTSPEFYMKKLLSQGFDKIFTLTHCFRDEPKSSTHHFQFIMLEWYRAQENYFKIMDDAVELITHCHHKFELEPPPVKKETVDQICKRLAGFKISDFLERNDFEHFLNEKFPTLITSNNLSWNDLFFLFFLNIIEPQLEKNALHILYEYPAPLAALSTIKNEKWSERFEIYFKGIELANCFNELIDKEELTQRFNSENSLKKSLYSYELPQPKEFYQTMNALPKSSGIALGIDRLFMGLKNNQEIFHL